MADGPAAGVDTETAARRASGGGLVRRIAERWPLALGGVALLAILWLALGGRGAQVTVAEVVRGRAAEIVYATGVVEPEYWAEVRPMLRARIVETCRCEGASVEAGAVLVRLDASQSEAQLAEIEARLSLARQQLLRAADLLARGVGAKSVYDTAEAAVAELEATRAAQRRALADYTVRAPLDGRVLRLDGEPGEAADPAVAVAWVGQPSPRLIVAEVNEEDIPRIEVGQTALLKADAFPGRALEAEVKAVTPKGDPVLKTYRVRLALPEDTPLFIGMSVDVNVVVREVAEARLAPAAAVVSDEAGAAVFVVDASGVARRRAVEIGLRDAAVVELLDGPDIGARIVSPALEGLRDGARVHVVGRAPAPAGRE